MDKIEEITCETSPEMEIYNIWMEFSENLLQELTKELLIKK